MKRSGIFILILLLLSGGSIFLAQRKFSKNKQILDGRFGNNQSEKLETRIRIVSEVGEVDHAIVFQGDDVHKNFGDMNYRVSIPIMEVEFGQCLVAHGTVSRPQAGGHDEGETLYHFPYPEYLAKDGVYLLYKVKHTEVSDTCPPLTIFEKVKLFFLRLKNSIITIFLEKYEQPYAGFVAGVLIAGKGLMSKETLDMFKRVSLSHVVVLSGSNVSIIVAFIKFLFDAFFKIFRLKENRITEIFKKVLMMILITSFVLLTGGGAPIARAFISATCALIFFKEQTSQLYALTVVVLIMTILNPFQTLYDPSFHLTCCATYGLIMFSTYFDELIIFSPLNSMPNFLREIISVTLATQVFVFPYIMFMSSSFSTVFLLSNVIVLPLIPFIMLLGFVTLFPWVSAYAISANNVILHVVFFLINLLSRVPYGYIIFSKKTSIGMLVCYGVLVLFLLKKSRTVPQLFQN